LLGGKPIFHDVRAQLLFQELREIEHFRAEYGFAVSNLSDIDDFFGLAEQTQCSGWVV
tara:strand:+ start:467 stop:640 length:174 start_codon:yes stop_codon:yes gene_type:complete